MLIYFFQLAICCSGEDCSESSNSLSCGVTLAAWHNQFITLVVIRIYESYINLQCEHRKWCEELRLPWGRPLPSCLLELLFDPLLKNFLSGSVKSLFRFFTLISFDFDSTKKIRDKNMLCFRNNPFGFSVWVQLSDVSHSNRWHSLLWHKLLHQQLPAGFLSHQSLICDSLAATLLAKVVLDSLVQSNFRITKVLNPLRNACLMKMFFGYVQMLFSLWLIWYNSVNLLHINITDGLSFILFSCCLNCVYFVFSDFVQEPDVYSLLT